MITDKCFNTFKYGFWYSHMRNNKWSFSFTVNLTQFLVGADWWFADHKLQDITISLGFIQIGWTRCV